jgi:pyruvate-formate lyase-activating enzyme
MNDTTNRTNDDSMNPAYEEPAILSVRGDDDGVIRLSPRLSAQVPLVEVRVLVYPSYDAAAQVRDIQDEMRRIADEQLPATFVEFANEVRQARLVPPEQDSPNWDVPDWDLPF